jgi:hypothetical protein
MGTVHFILQGKGGVGKSLVASILCQYLRQYGLPVSAVDTDPVNSTLTGYKELEVKRLNIMEGDDVDQRRFDKLIEIIFQQPENGHIVIDNGASSFVPLCSYLKENDALTLIRDEGHQVLLHTIFTGGQAIGDTAAGIDVLAASFPETPLVIWLNRYFGDIATDGKKFEEFKIYKERHSQFRAIIEIPHRKHSTFGKDLEELYVKRSTFDSAINSSLPIMTRQRLKMFWSEVQKEIDKAHLV